MNIILIEENELTPERTVIFKDIRHKHIRDVLKAHPGDSLSCGVIGRSKGQGILISVTREESIISYTAQAAPAEPLPFRLIIGMVRPIQAKRIFKTAAVFGIEALHWIPTALGEKSYARAGVWQEYHRLLMEGASQGGRVCIPRVEVFSSIEHCIEADSSIPGQKIIFHPGKGIPGIGGWSPNHPMGAVTAALGSERGWTENEVLQFREGGFEPRGLGDAVLRTEDAVTTVLALLSCKTGFMD